MKKNISYTECEKLLSNIQNIQAQLAMAHSGFAYATDEDLIDSYSYEILALHKKYEYLLKCAKEQGLLALRNAKIS